MYDIYEDILSLKKSGDAGVLVTVVEKKGSVPADIGAKMLVCSSGEIKGTVGGGTLENEALKKAREVLQSQKSVLEKYSLGEKRAPADAVRLGMMCGGNITLFYEYIGETNSIFLFGAGHVGKALVYHLRNRNNCITVIDSREDMLDAIEGALKISVQDYGNITEVVNIPDGSFVVVATHSHKLDFEVLKNIYASDWKPDYVGLIASSRKAKIMVKKLYEEVGNNIDLRNLYMPIGLDIGGKTIDEIAISIIAEMQALRYGKKPAIHMRNRGGKND